MTSIHYGCQSYPWKMSQNKYVGALGHMVQTAKRAGFAGLEIELDMLGSWLDDAAGAHRVFDENGLALTALVFHQSCRAPQQSAQEQELLARVLDFLAFFPGARPASTRSPSARANAVSSPPSTRIPPSIPCSARRRITS